MGCLSGTLCSCSPVRTDMPCCDLLDGSSFFGPFRCRRLELKNPASSEVRELCDRRILRPIQMKVRKAASAPRTAAAMAMPAMAPPWRPLGQLAQDEFAEGGVIGLGGLAMGVVEGVVVAGGWVG